MIPNHQEHEAASDLSKQIDFARELIKRGLVVQAKTELEKSVGPTPVRSLKKLQARIATNLGACAMAEEDTDNAVYWSNEAYRLQPENPAVVANAALAAHQSDDTVSGAGTSAQIPRVKPVRFAGDFGNHG